MKKLIYDLVYIDNGAVTANTSQKLKWAFEQLDGIFNPYQFELQQFCSNDALLNEIITTNKDTDKVHDQELFGLIWNTSNDTLSAKKTNP